MEFVEQFFYGLKQNNGWFIKVCVFSLKNNHYKDGSINGIRTKIISEGKYKKDNLKEIDKINQELKDISPLKNRYFEL